jgi:hypothetical protein
MFTYVKGASLQKSRTIGWLYTEAFKCNRHHHVERLVCIDKMHRNKTRVHMPAKMFPHLKLLRWLFMVPTLGFDTKHRNSFLIQLGVFSTIKTRF